MYTSVHRHPTDRTALDFTGSAGQMVDIFNTLDDDVAWLEIGGLSVGHAERGGKHNGLPAVRISLLDSTGARDVGRLVLVEDAGTRDEEVEWTIYYSTPLDADEALRLWKARKARPKLATAEGLDFAYDEDTVEEAIARVAADFGVLVTVTNPEGPGGGWPVVTISGQTERVVTFLKDSYHVPENELDSYLS